MGTFSTKKLHSFLVLSGIFNFCVILLPQVASAQLFGGFQRGSSSRQVPSYSQPSYNKAPSQLKKNGYSGPYSSVKTTNPKAASVRTIRPANTSWSAQREVTSQIPWAKLNQNAKVKIQGVTQSPSIYRRLPVNQIECDPQFFTFALRNPDTVVNMWKVFGVSEMTLQKSAPYKFAGQDGSGTTCTAELVYGDSNIHIYYGTGVYQGPVFKRRITGRCVAVVRTKYKKGNNQYVLENKMDVFLKVDNVAADLVARSLQPMVGKSTDHNFRESLAFLQAFSSTAVTEPHRTSYLIHKMPSVGNETKSQFHKIVATIPQRQIQYQKSLQPNVPSTSQPIPIQKVQANSVGRNGNPNVSSVGSPAVFRSIR